MLCWGLEHGHTCISFLSFLSFMSERSDTYVLENILIHPAMKLKVEVHCTQGKERKTREERKDIHACPWIRDSQPRGFCWEAVPMMITNNKCAPWTCMYRKEGSKDQKEGYTSKPMMCSCCPASKANQKENPSKQCVVQTILGPILSINACKLIEVQ